MATVAVNREGSREAEHGLPISHGGRIVVLDGSFVYGAKARTTASTMRSGDSSFSR
jgi:hypothetical protein